MVYDGTDDCMNKKSVVSGHFLVKTSMGIDGIALGHELNLCQTPPTA